MKINDRLKEIVRLDREIDETRDASNVITLANRKPRTELQRQRAAHVTAIQSYSAPGGYH